MRCTGCVVFAVAFRVLCFYATMQLGGYCRIFTLTRTARPLKRWWWTALAVVLRPGASLHYYHRSADGVRREAGACCGVPFELACTMAPAAVVLVVVVAMMAQCWWPANVGGCCAGASRNEKRLGGHEPAS